MHGRVLVGISFLTPPRASAQHQTSFKTVSGQTFFPNVHTKQRVLSGKVLVARNPRIMRTKGSGRPPKINSKAQKMKQRRDDDDVGGDCSLARAASLFMVDHYSSYCNLCCKLCFLEEKFVSHETSAD